MSSVESSPLEVIQQLLALQATAGRPQAAVCATIAGLKDLCELNTAAIPTDWRRGPSGGGGGGGGHGRNGGGSGGGRHGGFRNSGAAPGSSAAAAASSTSGHGSPGGAAGSSSHHHHPMRYQSMFRNTSKAVDETILNNIILSKLNKFSGSTYNDIRDFLYQILGSGEPDLSQMIREFMLLVFNKAASEEVYCPLYAKLLAEISSRYKVILDEMKTLQANYLNIFDDIEDPEGGESYEEFLAKNKEKRYRQGYTQFLAELAALEILELSNLERTFQKILEQTLRFGKIQHKRALIEEYVDCLLRISKVLKKKMAPFFIEARASLLRISKDMMEELQVHKESYPSLSPKARFILMDVRDNLSGM